MRWLTVIVLAMLVFVECILRFIFLLVLVCSIVGLFVLMDTDADDLVSPSLLPVLESLTKQQEKRLYP